MADRYDDTLGNRTERAADKALGSHDEPHTTGDVVGETVGGLSGAATGAALGSLGGPIGTIIGGIAGAVSGWWSGRAISEAASSFDHDDDYYRGHYSSRSGSTLDTPVRDTSVGRAVTGSSATSDSSLTDSSVRGSSMSGSSSSMGSSSMGSSSMGSSSGASGYDTVRPAYQLGHLAGLNPDYRGRQFDDIEPDLRRGWESHQGNSDWHSVRDYARESYGRSQQRFGSSGGQAGMSGAQDRATNSGLLDRAADKLDDLKDRFDGNPASRPGPDATDRRL